MSSTNKTSNLALSQFIGTDSPKWLTDYNADMQKIDAGVGDVQSQANATDLIVSGHTTSIQNNTQTISDQQTAITQLRTDVNGNTGSINTINELLGNGEPTTSNKTVIGAINELKTDVDATSSQLTNCYVLKAIQNSVDGSGDGTKTTAQLLHAAYEALAVVVDALANDEYIKPTHLRTSGTYNNGFDADYHSGSILSKGNMPSSINFGLWSSTGSSVDYGSVRVASESSGCRVVQSSSDANGVTFTAHTSDLQSDTSAKVVIFYDVYKKLS